MSFKIIVNKKNFVLLVFNIVFILLLLFCFILYKNHDVLFDSSAKVIFPWVIISLILHIINFRVRKYTLYEFGMWYIVLSYIFLFGLVFREIFSLNYSLLWNPIIYYTDEELLISYFFSLIAINFFGIGYFAIKGNKRSFNSNVEVNNNKVNQIFYFGLLLIIVGGICMLINDIRAVSIMRSYNSYLGYKYVSQNGLLDDLAFLFLPGVFLILFSGKLSAKQRKYLFLIVMFYLVVIMMLTGSRKIKLFSLISVFLGYAFLQKKDDNNRKKVSIIKVLIYFVLGIVLLNLLVTIRESRFEISTVIPMFISNLTDLNFLKDIFGEVFSETGLTQLSITSIMKIVPSIFPFEYGMTFIKTIPSFLPIGWAVGDFFSGASSTNVINSYLSIPVGSSLIGDLYWNFGIVGGFVSSFIIGLLFGKLFNIDNNGKDKISMAIYFCLFSQLIVLVRAEFFDIFRSLFVIFVIYFLLRKTSFPLKGVRSDEK